MVIAMGHRRRTELGALLLLVSCGCAGVSPESGTERARPLSDKEMAAGIRAWLGAQDFAQYDSLSDEQKPEWLRMFWQKHDPTPTTTENEFQAEFFRRVRYALLYFPNAFELTPWDDRGEVYIRYGEPDERSFMLDEYWNRRKALGSRGARLKGLSPTQAADVDFDETTTLKEDYVKIYKPPPPMEFDGEVWTYYRLGLTFQFQDEDKTGKLTLVPYTDVFGSPAQADYANHARTKVLAVELQPAVYTHDYGDACLDYALDVARFRATGMTFNVDVNLGYPLALLARGGSDSATVSLRRAVVVRDDSLREIVSEVSVLCQQIEAVAGSQRLLVEQKTYNLPPGMYELSISVEDLFSGKYGVMKKTFRLPEFVSREVQEISDIELAAFIWSVYEPGRQQCVKANRMVVPLPSHVYLEDQPITFYFEIYNLVKNAQDSAVYTIEYEVLDPGAKRVFHKEETARLCSAGRDVDQFGTLEGADLAPGEYLLSIRVLDETTGHGKRTLTPFKVVPATDQRNATKRNPERPMRPEG